VAGMQVAKIRTFRLGFQARRRESYRRRIGAGQREENSDEMGLGAVAAWQTGDFRISLPFKRQKSE